MAPACVAVAYSGGRDSLALLHATLAAAAPLGIKVVALHVHHGLSPFADEWLAKCAAQCERWAKRGWPVTFASFCVEHRPAKSESVEAWARTVRYRALRSMALQHGAPLVLLSQHRRDQAETFVLQALRGAGANGLAGMPRCVVRECITWVRPWLDKPREDIEAYVARHRLKYVEDESNRDPRFARNRLRLQVWPALASAFPQAEAAFADSAQWAQEAAVCLSELAAQDLPPLLSGADGLNLNAWFELSAARRSNVLRAWLTQRLGVPPRASLMSRLAAELLPKVSSRWPLGLGELRAYRGVLRHVRRGLSEPENPGCEESLAVDRAGDFNLPGWGGRLRVARATEGGVPLAWLGRLEIRQRQGSEQFQSGLLRPPRSLKKQYQAVGVPAWDRQGPLFYSGGQLIFVPGLGIDARVLALPGQPQVSLRWLPAPGQQFDEAGVVSADS